MGRLSKEQSRRTTMGLGQKCKAVIFEPSSELSTWASSGNSFDFCPKNERTIVVLIQHEWNSQFHSQLFNIFLIACYVGNFAFYFL